MNLLFILLSLCLGVSGAENTVYGPVPFPEANPTAPIYAMGDLHGDFELLVKLLKFTGLIQHSLAPSDEPVWIGGNATLIQLGDVWDRGVHGARIHQYLSALTKSAAAYGGLVVRLVGNHEMLNLAGTALDRPGWVKPAELQYFVTLANRSASFAHDGVIGRELRALHAGVWASRAHRTIFTHGGLTPLSLSQFGATPPEEAVQPTPPTPPLAPAPPAVRQAPIIPLSADAVLLSVSSAVVGAMRTDAFRAPVLQGGGPLWDRSMVMDAMQGRCEVIDEVLDVLGDADGDAEDVSGNAVDAWRASVADAVAAVGGSVAGAGPGGTAGGGEATAKQIVDAMPHERAGDRLRGGVMRFVENVVGGLFGGGDGWYHAGATGGVLGGHHGGEVVVAEDGDPESRVAIAASGDPETDNELEERVQAAVATVLGESGLPRYERVVVGHTIQRMGVKPMCDGRVFGIDTGMSYAYGGLWRGVLRIDPGGEATVMRMT